MINVSPVGRNATPQQRKEFEMFDLQHNIRTKFVDSLKEKFSDFGLTYVCGTLVIAVEADYRGQFLHWWSDFL